MKHDLYDNIKVLNNKICCVSAQITIKNLWLPAIVSKVCLVFKSSSPKIIWKLLNSLKF